MRQTAGGFLVGTAVGIALPHVLLAARNLCSAAELPPGARVFFSPLASYSLALGGRVLAALIAGRPGGALLVCVVSVAGGAGTGGRDA